MGSVLVVVPAPILQFFPGVRSAHEPVCVQTFRAQLTVERLNEGIIGGFARAAEVEWKVLDPVAWFI